MHSYAPGGAKSAEWFTPYDLRAFYVTQMLDQKRDRKTHKNEQTMDRVRPCPNHPGFAPCVICLRFLRISTT